MLVILSSTAGFLVFSLLLALLILLAKHLLVPDTLVPVTLNGKQQLTGSFGQSLLSVLADNDIHVPSACAGAGTCGLCRVHIDAGIPLANPIEKALLSAQQVRCGERLACQVHLRKALEIDIADEVLQTHAWQATVISNRCLSTLIRELVLQPDDENFSFEPGDFVQITAPAGTVLLAAIDPGDTYRADWTELDIESQGVRSDEPQTRAYSLANRPEDLHVVTLMIRLALPPVDITPAVPPGFVSSWLFSRVAGDTVSISGPHRGFNIVDDTRELVFVGGGVGMAPLRSMIHRQIGRDHREPMTFFYGARTQADLLYRDEFDALSDARNGFNWVAALSEPDPDWGGERGFIHTILRSEFLEQHDTVQSCDYYLCGPPLMIKAVVAELRSAGVQDTHIYKDEFA